MDTDKSKVQPTKVATGASSIPAEDLPLPDRMRVADATNHFQNIAAGWYIDAKDTVNNWCVAEILAKQNGGDMQIGYDGWSDKYNEVKMGTIMKQLVKQKSSKVAPFRLHSRGYTGQVKIPLHKLSFSLEQLANVIVCADGQRKARLDEVLASGFKSLATAFDVTQYLRGQLFIYVDFLMANEYKDPDKEIPLVIEFLKQVVKLIVLWLHSFPKFIRAVLLSLTFQFSEHQLHPKLYLVDRNVALAACGYEMMDMLKWLFCLSHRTLVFFVRYDVAVEKGATPFVRSFSVPLVPKRDKDPSIPLLMEKLKAGEDMIFGLFVNFFNVFCEASGLDAVLDIIVPERLIAKANDSMMANYKLPMEVIAMIVAPFKGIKAIASASVMKQLAEAVKTIFIQKMQSLETKDIKNLNKEQMMSSLETIKDVLKLQYSEEDASKIVETHEMLLSLKFIQSPYLEKRLQGVADIRKMIERVEPRAPGQRTLMQFQPQVAQKTSWLTADYLAKWIISNKILETIFNENVHDELIKRATHILLFLAQRELITNEIIELLWKCQLEKHEDIVRAIYDVVKEILSYLKMYQIRLIQEKIKKIPLESYDEKLISFMKDFTIKAFNARENKKDMPFEPPNLKGIEVTYNEAGEVAQPSDNEVYFLSTFWTLIQDETPVSQALTEQALNAIKEIIHESYCVKYYPQYFYLCLQNLKKHRSVKQSLVLAPHILGTYNVRRITGPRLLSKTFLGTDLAALVLDDCSSYLDAAHAKIIGPSEDIGDKVFVGKYSHVANLETRLKFLDQILNAGPEDLRLGKDGLCRLWNLFVQNCHVEFDTRVFLNWVSYEKESGSGTLPKAIFRPDESAYLFEIICGSRQKMANAFGILYYRCFAKHFKLVNMHNFSISIIKNKITVKRFDNLVGIDALWENAARNTDETTRAKFTELLVDVYLNLDDSLREKKSEICRSFLDRCMASIMKVDSETSITNLVKALLLFTETADGSKYSDSQFSSQFSSPTRYFITVIKPGVPGKKMEIPLNVTVGQLRKKIADAFNIPFNCFQISTKTKVVSSEDDDTPYREIGWSDQVTVQLNPNSDNGNFKTLLSQNQQYISHLFLLLSKETAAYVDPVWDLLMMLPPNQKMKSDIENLCLPGTGPDAWDSLLDSTSVHKFLYSLRIVERIIGLSPETRDSSQPENRAKWLVQFQKKGGLTHLFYSLLKLPITSLHRPLTRKCFALLMRLLISLQQDDPLFERNVTDYDKVRGKMVERVLTILEAFAHYSIQQPGEKEEERTRKEKPQQIYKTKEEPLKKEEAKTESQTLLKRKNKQLEESRAFEHGLRLIRGHDITHSYFEHISRFGKLKDLLLKGLVLTDNRFIRLLFGEELLSICNDFKDLPYSDTHPHAVFLPLMLTQMIHETLGPDVVCVQFYKFLCSLIDSIPRKNLETLPIKFNEVLSDAVSLIKQHEIRENTSTDTDYMLVGLMNLVESLLKKFPTKKVLIGHDCGVINELLRCLFEFPSTSTSGAKRGLPPKCKSQISRLAAFSLLCVLARDTPTNIKLIIDYVLPIHVNGSWRTKRLTDWLIAPETTEKSTTGYVGLKNLGCTCYMNSLMQQLYMIPSFRNDVLAVDDPDKTTPPEDNLLFQTQCLFSALNRSVKQYYNPKLFCQAFKDWEKKPINVLEQMDVDEFFNLFMDKLENAIKGTSQARTIKYHFGGLFANQLICKDCPHSSVREEPFLALNLQVKNKKSLQQCLESFVEGELLQGSDAYYCEKCDKKVTTLKRVCIRRLPRYLICVLKRFEFNYDTMQKFKVNEYCEFPMRLNMEMFTEEGLSKKDKEKEREKAKKEGRDIEEAQSSEQKNVAYPPEYYEYKLTGVLIHIGTAETGHYYSLIMDREKTELPEKDRWYEFNDTLVNQYDQEDIKDDAFGGEEKPGYDGPNARSNEKIRNAYLLVYERAKPYDPQEDDEEEDGGSRKVGQTGEPQIAEGILKAVLAENIKYWHNKFMFNDDYFDFAYKLCAKWNSSENLLANWASKNVDYEQLGLSPETMKRHAFQTAAKNVPISAEESQKLAMDESELKKVDITVFKYEATFLLTTLMRSRKREMLPDFVDLAKAYLNKHFEAAQWLVWQFTNAKLLHEFILENNDADACRFSVGLLYCAMLRVYETEKSRMAVSGEECMLPNFANFVFSQLADCKKHPGGSELFFQLVSRIAILGPEIREHLLKAGGIKRLIGYWKAIPETGWNVATEIRYRENVKSELGQSWEVDERFRSPFEEYFSLRKEQYQQSLATNTFLFESLSLLLRGTTLDLNALVSPLALPMHVKGAGVDAMSKSLLSSVKIIQSFIKECRSNIAIQAVAKALSHMAWENMEFVKQCVRGIVCGINDVDWDELKKYFYMIWTLVGLKCSSQKAVVELMLTELDTVMRNNKKSFYATFFSIDYILVLARDHEQVHEWYKNNAARWSWILDWVKTNPVPALNSPAAAVRPYKSKEQNEALAGQFAYSNSEQVQNTWRVQSDNLLRELQELKQGTLRARIVGHKVEASRELGFSGGVYYEKFYYRQLVELLQ